MIPLAITSTKGWIRRLGKKWTMLHRLIYISATAGVVHYIWLVKKDIRKPMIYAVILAVLLLWRIGDWIIKRQKGAAAKLPQARPVAS
jgi:sulfoxide reductase heme-binding subunit YedZ